MSTNGHTNGISEKNNNESTPEGKGGLGGITSLTYGSRDIRLVAKAIEKWDIPATARKVLPAELIRIAVNKTEKTRNRMAAIRGVVAMAGQNQNLDPAVQKHIHTIVDLSDADLARIAAGDTGASGNGVVEQA